MIWLIKFLIFGHVHKWKTVDRREMSWNGKFYYGATKREEFIRVYCECEKCGEPRHWDMRA